MDKHFKGKADREGEGIEGPGVNFVPNSKGLMHGWHTCRVPDCGCMLPCVFKDGGKATGTHG